LKTLKTLKENPEKTLKNPEVLLIIFY